MKYFTQEWADAVKAKSVEDAKYTARGKKFTEKFQWIATSCPGGVDRLLEVETQSGKVVLAKMEEKPSPADFGPADTKKYLARATADYDVWIKVNTGELKAVDAQMGKGLRLEGNIMKVMPMAGVLQAFIDMAGTVPVEY
jgi:putative sterol carrier protein